MGMWRPKWCVFTGAGTSPAHSSPWQTNMQVSDRLQPVARKHGNKDVNPLLLAPLYSPFASGGSVSAPNCKAALHLSFGLIVKARLKHRFYLGRIENWRELRTQTAARLLLDLNATSCHLSSNNVAIHLCLWTHAPSHFAKIWMRHTVLGILGMESMNGATEGHC